MPSRPLSADRSTVVKLFTRLDNEAIDLAKHRTEMPAAVAGLAQLVPPARLDLVDDVLVGVGRREPWPPEFAARLAQLLRPEQPATAPPGG